MQRYLAALDSLLPAACQIRVEDEDGGGLIELRRGGDGSDGEEEGSGGAPGPEGGEGGQQQVGLGLEGRDWGGGAAAGGSWT